MFDLLIVIFGFGMIIFIHEAGHFLAARWAGIRVLAFAVGFGPAAFSWRKGLGLRRGSSEREYVEIEKRVRGKARADQDPRDIEQFAGMSPTEYRLNMLPFGGYVKMLGQEDVNPGAVSEEPDSYQNCKVWKRMIVISAGVVMNIVSAAVLFVVVFTVGLETEPAKVGSVGIGSPASYTMPVNAASLGIDEPGLKPGDVIVSVDGRTPNSFNDLTLASAMSKRGRAVELVIEREGVAEPLVFHIVPKESQMTGLLELGVQPAFTTQLRMLSPRRAKTAAGRKETEGFARQLASMGLDGAGAGMHLTHVNGSPIQHLEEMYAAVRSSGGVPVSMRFTSDTGGLVEGAIQPAPEFEHDIATTAAGDRIQIDHVLGLAGPMFIVRAEEEEDDAYKKGLRTNDTFVRIGNAEFPSLPQGMAQIRLNKRRSITVTVERAGEDGETELVTIQPTVSRKGMIGFLRGDTNMQSAVVSMPERSLISGSDEDERTFEPAATRLISVAGTKILRVGDTEVANLGEVRNALQEVTRDAHSSGAQSAQIEMTLELPYGVVETKTWELNSFDLERLHGLTWESPLGVMAFMPEQFILKGESPADSLDKGLSETRRVMLSTYTTFVRLFQGTVKVEHLKGPVGIAHIGTLMAERGWVWLLFLAAIVSVNLAVINFLPLPIVDGGQFIFLLFEGIRGKPVPLGVQNAAALAGLVLIGAVFIIVTFNDIVGLFGG